MKTAAKIRLIIFMIMVAIIVVQAIVLHSQSKKMNYVTILTYEDGQMLSLDVRNLEEPIIMVTPDFVERFSKYSSPFNDGKTFAELIRDNLRNRAVDHYGTPRGTSQLRRIHEGIDLFVPENTPVYPLTDYGIVTEVSDDPNYLIEAEAVTRDGEVTTTMVEYGKTVRVIYPEGIESLYTHLNEVSVSVGQEVFKDTQLGLTGVTGNLRRSGKDSHLHLELRDKNNQSFDPRHRLHFDQASLSHFLQYLKLD